MAVGCEDAREAYLNGNVTPEIERHLDECASCGFMRQMRELAVDATGTPDPTHASGGDPVAGAERLPPSTRDRYRIEQEIGRGGLGRVLRARDLVLERTIAIKEILHGDDATRRRFVREAMITARLQHPAIVPVYEAARWADHAPFYAMKLVAGRPLSDAIAEATTLEARLALLPNVLAVADAMAYAHSERVIHRDLRPQNVMVGAFGETVVIDWGLAKDLTIDDRDAPDAGPYREMATDRTAAGALIGTVAYMAPEQAARKPVDERADVYALGAILYHVVTGVSPHQGQTSDEVIAHVKAGEIAPASTREPRLPADLAAVIAKAMAHAEADRYPTARELAADLRRYVSGQLVEVHRYSAGELLRRWARRHRVALAVAAVAAAVLIAYGTWSVQRIVAESHRADDQRDLANTSARDAAHERDRAIAQANRAIVAQARYAVDRDPTAALALLATMSPAGPGWDAARVIAADARSRPRVIVSAALLQNGGAPVESSKWTIDVGHSRAFAWSWSTLWIVDLTTGAVRTIQGRQWPDAMVACDDGKRVVDGGYTAIAFGGGFDVDVLDVDTGVVAPVRLADADALWHFRVGCAATAALDFDGGRLRWWDARHGTTRVLAENIAEAKLSGDLLHAISVDQHGTTRWWDLSTNAPTIGLGDFPDAEPGAISADGTTAILSGPKGDVAVRVGSGSVALPPAVNWIVGRDGDWVAGLAADRRVILRRGGALDREEILAADVASLSLSADGRWLIGREQKSGRVHAWDMDAGAWPEVLGDEPAVAAAPLGPDRAVTRHGDGTVRVWTLAAPRQLLDGADSVRTSRDGRWIVDESDGGLRRVDARHSDAIETTVWPVAKPPASTVRLLRTGAVAPNGDVLARIGDDVWAWRRGGDWTRLGRAPETGAMSEPEIGWSRDGAAFAWADAEIVVWDQGGERRLAPLAAPAVRRLVAVRDDLALAAAIDTTDDTVRLVDLVRGGETPLPGSSRGDTVAFSRDGRALLTGAASGDGYLVWDVATARSHAIPRNDARPRGALLSDDGARVALGTMRAVVVVDVADGTRHVLDTGSGPIGTFDAAGTRMITASESGVRLWDVASAEPRVLLPGNRPDVRLVAIGADGAIVATSGGVFLFADDLPSEPCALRAALGAPCP